MIKNRIIRLKIMIFLTLVLLASGSLFAATRNSNEIILQGFNWESYSNNIGWYKVLSDKVEDISESGFTSVWLPPSSFAYDGEGIYPDSRGYIPHEYYNLNSKYGNKEQLKALISKLSSLKVKAIADLVINHRGPSRNVNGLPHFNNPDWGMWAFTGGPGMIGQGAPDTGAATRYAFDLDFTNELIINYLVDWMNWLKEDIGFSGFRYDFAKGYAGYYIGVLNSRTNPDISIGEYWTNMNNTCGSLCYNQNYHRQDISNWIDQTWKYNNIKDTASCAFDFTTKGILQEAIKNKEFWRLTDEQRKPSGLIGWWPERSVTFIDNHDTGSTQLHWPFGDWNSVLQGYVYILTHPGIPSIFWDHYYDWGMYDQIKTLIKIRKRAGINSVSSLIIDKAEWGLYSAFVDDKVALKIGPKSWNPGPNWKLSIAGNDFAVWEKK